MTIDDIKRDREAPERIWAMTHYYLCEPPVNREDMRFVTEYVRADTIEALQARVAEMEEALAPFAEVADECDDWDMDDGNQAPIDAGQCRAARAALSQEKEG